MTSITKNKIYFASDFHLGVDAHNTSKEREQIIVSWLDEIKDSAAAIYFLGDIFDYWYEYKNSIPSGFSDFLSAIKGLKKGGIEIHFFRGNHDMWMFNYFPDEYGIPVHERELVLNLNGKSFFLAHGDGLGPGDGGYKIIKSIFSNKICQWLFSLIHPTIALAIMKRISQRDSKKYMKPDGFNKNKEWLISFAEKQKEIDYFIFGHRHLLYDYNLNNGSRVINLGDWISYNSFAVWDGKDLKIQQFGDYVLEKITF